MYDASEISRFGGRPVHLFVFQLQGLYLRYSAGPKTLTLGGNTYTSAPGIARSEINQTSERAQNQVTITAPYLLNPSSAAFPPTQALGDLFRPYPPSGSMSVSCMSLHGGDADSELVLEWTGRVATPQFNDTQLQLMCERSRASKNFKGNTGRYTRGCWKALYACGVNAADFDFSATLTAVTGLSLTATAFGAHAAGRLEGGTIQWTRSNGLIEQRSIMSHAGSVITINYGGAELATGLVLTAYPGCAHTTDDCNDYFSNGVNYGGQPHLNVENPFDGHRVAW